MDRIQLKRNARAAIRENQTSILWIGLAYMALILILAALSMKVSGEWTAFKLMAESMISGGEFSVPAMEARPAADILVLALDIMNIMLSVGFLIAALNTSRRLPAAVGNLFDGFGMFFRALAVGLLRYCILMLWSMIYVLPLTLLTMTGETMAMFAPVICLPLLIPMLCAAYRYRQALYLMLDNPGLNAMQCLKASAQLMEGRKWELFKLDLSFIGWYLLCLIPVAAVWVLPYTNVCFAGYYDEIMEDYAARHRSETPDAPSGDGESGPDPDDGRDVDV